MALYCTETPLTPTLTLIEGRAFTETWNPGEKPILSGIYRCSCGGEAVASLDVPLPTEAHCHQRTQDPIAWRLILAAEEPMVVAMPARMKAGRARPREATEGLS